MPPISLRTRGISFALVLALLAAGWAAALAFTLWRLRDDALDNGYAAAMLRARYFEEHLTQTLQFVDLTAGSLRPAGDGRAEVSGLGEHLRGILRPMPFIRSLSLLDTEGRVVASSNPDNLGVHVAFEAFYPQADADAEILRIGLPWQGRDLVDGGVATAARPVAPDQISFVPVLRRLSSGEKYWLVASINPDYFLDYWTQLLDPAYGHAQWLRYDDVLLVSSALGESLGTSSQSGAVAQRLRTAEHGQFEQHLLDGDDVLTAYRASAHFPAIIAVHLHRDALLADWHKDVRWLTLIVLPVVLALIMAGIALDRRRRRIDTQQHELDRERRLAESVFAASSVPIMLTLPDGRIISVNPAFEQVSGYSRDEAIGQTPRLLKSGLNPPETYQALWATITRGESWRGELQNRRRNGETYWESLVISAVRDEAGGITHFIASMEDVSDKKRREAELRLAKEAAEAASIAKSRFLATMSHEIRTPMNGVLGMAQILMEDVTEVERREYAKVIFDSGQTLLRLLNDILDLSKVEGGKLVLHATDFDPLSLMGEVAALFGEVARTKGLHLHYAWLGPAAQRYLGDEYRLRQMLTNFVGNAIKFTAQGSVRIEIKEVSRQLDGACLEFSVIDTGIGLAADKLPLLFQPFSQADGSTTREFGGSGLGLSIVRNLAQLMGGDVGVESEDGKGSRFWFNVWVRLAESEEGARPTEAKAGAAQPGFSGSVLLVEDNPVNRMVILTLLQKLGMRVDSAENGEEACAALMAGLDPDIVLMDIQMPKLDGYAATERIREWEAATGRPRTVIVALTANAFAEDRERCLAAGMDDFMSKPVSKDTLQATLARWLLWKAGPES